MFTYSISANSADLFDRNWRGFSCGFRVKWRREKQMKYLLVVIYKPAGTYGFAPCFSKLINRM